MERAGRLLGASQSARRCLTPEELALAAWPAAVGRKAARHTKAVALEGSRLIVETGDDLWRRNLELLSGQILANLRSMLGPSAPRWVQYRLAAPRRPVRSEAPQPEFRLRPHLEAEDAERIEDPVLRRIYIRSKRKALAS